VATAEGWVPAAPRRCSPPTVSWRSLTIPNEFEVRLAIARLMSFSTSAGPKDTEFGADGALRLIGAWKEPNGVPAR
jgi:hypothetical protein